MIFIIMFLSLMLSGCGEYIIEKLQDRYESLNQEAVELEMKVNPKMLVKVKPLKEKMLRNYHLLCGSEEDSVEYWEGLCDMMEEYNDALHDHVSYGF